MVPADAEVSSRWTGRPVVARALRWLVAALPIVASFALTFWLSRTLPPQRLGVPVWVWLIGAIAVATIVLFGVERSARRVLPLAALFRLSLVFPDKAPSRFRLAIRSQTTRTLERDIERARAAGEHGDVTEAAELVLVLVAALNRHDRLTRGHSERVRAYSRMLGEELGLSGEDLDRLNWAALLHDIGKLRVPYEILNSDTRPTEEQWQILKRHAEWGEELTQPLRDWLGDAWHAIGQHHERWDGDGYPRGLGTTDISLYGRIVAVADTYDVITSTRSYKQPMAPDQARQELARCAGTQFDPVIVRAFLNLGIARIRPAMSPLAWLASLGGLIGTTSAPAIGSLAATLVTATAVTAGTLSVTPPAEPPAPIEIIDESGELALDVPLDPPGAAPGDAGALGDDAGSGGPTLTGTDESEAADANTPPGGASNDGVPGDGGDVAVAEPTPTPPPVQGPGNTTGSSPGTDPTPSPTATPTPTSTPVPTPTPTATPRPTATPVPTPTPTPRPTATPIPTPTPRPPATPTPTPGVPDASFLPAASPQEEIPVATAGGTVTLSGSWLGLDAPVVAPAAGWVVESSRSDGSSVRVVFVPADGSPGRVEVEARLMADRVWVQVFDADAAPSSSTYRV